MSVDKSRCNAEWPDVHKLISHVLYEKENCVLVKEKLCFVYGHIHIQNKCWLGKEKTGSVNLVYLLTSTLDTKYYHH